jgi:hypothetical protein
VGAVEAFKVNVRRDLSGDERKLKRLVWTNYVTTFLQFSILTDPMAKDTKTGFSVLTTMALKLTGRYRLIFQMTFQFRKRASAN